MFACCALCRKSINVLISYVQINAFEIHIPFRTHTNILHTIQYEIHIVIIMQFYINTIHTSVNEWIHIRYRYTVHRHKQIFDNMRQKIAHNVCYSMRMWLYMIHIYFIVTAKPYWNIMHTFYVLTFIIVNISRNFVW